MFDAKKCYFKIVNTSMHLGLDYLTLGVATPSLSDDEAQRPNLVRNAWCGASLLDMIPGGQSRLR